MFFIMYVHEFPYCWLGLVAVGAKIRWLVGGGGCVLLSFVYVFDMFPLGSLMHLCEGLSQTLYDLLFIILDLDVYVCVCLFLFYS